MELLSSLILTPIATVTPPNMASKDAYHPIHGHSPPTIGIQAAVRTLRQHRCHSLGHDGHAKAARCETGLGWQVEVGGE